MNYSINIIKLNIKTTLYLLISMIIAIAITLPATVHADPCMTNGGVYEDEECVAPRAPTLSYSVSYPACKVAPCPAQIRLSWSAPVYGETVTNYRITKSGGGPLGSTQTYTVNAPATSFDDFVYGGSYSYVVQAVNSYGYSNYSNRVYITIPR